MTISWILGYSGKTYRFFWTYNLRSMCRWVSGLYGLSHSSKFAKHYFSIAYFILDAFSRNWPVRSRKILKFTSRFKKKLQLFKWMSFPLKRSWLCPKICQWGFKAWNSEDTEHFFQKDEFITLAHSHGPLAKNDQFGCNEWFWWFCSRKSII